MIKNEISVETYKESLENKSLDGIYVFLMDDCSLCVEHLKRLEDNVVIKEINLVNCLEDIDFYWHQQGLDDMPVTRYYSKGDVVFEKGGIFYDKQQKQLIEVIK